MEPAVRSRLITGGSLIVLGLGLYVMQFLDASTQPLLLVFIGGVFLTAYFSTKTYGYLITGCIVAGLGIGKFGEEPRWFLMSDFTEIGLAIGFAMIYLIRMVYERRSHWWPLIPSAALFLAGLQAWRRFRLFVFSQRGWPLLIVIVGVLIILGAVGRRKKKPGG